MLLKSTPTHLSLSNRSHRTKAGDGQRHLTGGVGCRAMSFAPQYKAVQVLVGPAVVAAGDVVIGSGIRGSKLLVPTKGLLDLPGAQELQLAQ